MTHTNCTLGAIQSQEGGWGFVVRGERDKPLVALPYETKAEAEDARSLMAQGNPMAAITSFG